MLSAVWWYDCIVIVCLVKTGSSARCGEEREGRRRHSSVPCSAVPLAPFPSPSSLYETEAPADELIYFVYFALTVKTCFTLFCLLFSHDASHLKSINPPARSLRLPSAFFFIVENNYLVLASCFI